MLFRSQPRERFWSAGGRCLAAMFVTAAMFPATASGQSSPPSPADARPWDATTLVGLLIGHPPAPENRGYLDDWFETAQAAVLLGRHLTPHLKTEIEFSASAEGRRFVERYVQVPGYPYPFPLGADQFTRVREVGVSLTYQFFDNEWIHPFVQAGVAVDFDRVRTRTWSQSVFTGDPRQPGSQVVVAEDRNTSPVTTTHVRAVVGGGAKFYVTPRVFVRTDGRFGVGAGTQHLALRIGLGVDF